MLKAKWIVALMVLTGSIAMAQTPNTKAVLGTYYTAKIVQASDVIYDGTSADANAKNSLRQLKNQKPAYTPDDSNKVVNSAKDIYGQISKSKFEILADGTIKFTLEAEFYNGTWQYDEAKGELTIIEPGATPQVYTAQLSKGKVELATDDGTGMVIIMRKQ